MASSMGLVSIPVKYLDLDLDLLKIFGAGEGFIVKGASFNIILNDFLEEWNV